MIKYFKHPQKLASVHILFEGSNIEKPGEFGCTHMWEHLKCISIDQLEDFFYKKGIEFNAMTTEQYTSFHIQGLDSQVKKIAEAFIQTVTKYSRFSKKEFLNEKNVILQEWDDINYELYNNINHRLRMDMFSNPGPIGLKNDIKNMTFDKMNEFVENNFLLPIFVLVEQGSDWKINTKVNFKKTWESKKGFCITKENEAFPIIKSQNPLISKVSKFLIELDEIPYHQIILLMLNDGLKSPLMKELREKNGLIYHLNSQVNIINESVGYIHFSANINIKKIKKFNEIFNKVLQNDEWYSKERFNLVKNKTIIDMQISKKRGDNYPIEDFLHPQTVRALKIIKKMTYNDIQKYIKFYKKQNFFTYI